MTAEDILRKLDEMKYQEYLRPENTRWETLRESYKPSEIKTLIVGEAPPNGGTRFFYYENVPEYDNLFLAVMEVLYPTKARAYKAYRTASAKKELLEQFKTDGFYLMDLYPMPLDKKPKGKGKSFFAEVFMRRFNKEQIAKECIIILLNPAKVLEYPLKSLGYEVFVLPFPLYGGKAEFVQQFREIMKNR